mgnify:CR=1 FL=1
MTKVFQSRDCCQLKSNCYHGSTKEIRLQEKKKEQLNHKVSFCLKFLGGFEWFAEYTSPVRGCLQLF